jgi:hypothetical protein
MKLDDTLVQSAQNLHALENNFGNTKAFWEKSARLASIKGRSMTPYEMVLAHICALETKISNKIDAVDVYPEIAAMYAVLSSFSKDLVDPVENKLGIIEKDIQDMAAKLAPMPRAEFSASEQ